MRLLLFLALAASLSAQTRPHVIVTAEGKHDQPAAALGREDVTATMDRKPATIAEWTPLTGEHGALQLYIAIDDGVDTDLGNQLEDLRKFIRALSADAQVGVAYLRFGSAQMAQAMTSDHEKAAKSLRLPTGQPGISASPYIALSELFKKWPAAEARREVLLINSGIDPYYEPGPQNPYLDKAISDAQRGSVIVHSIYYAGTGHAGHSYWRVNWGQNYLSQLGDETGGEAYWQGTQSPVSFAPFLKDLNTRLQHQYLLTLERGNGKAGWQNVKVALEHGDASLMTPSKVWVQ